jgi:hypothetical protein
VSLTTGKQVLLVLHGLELIAFIPELVVLFFNISSVLSSSSLLLTSSSAGLHFHSFNHSLARFDLTVL